MRTTYKARTAIYSLALLAIVLSTSGSFSQLSGRAFLATAAPTPGDLETPPTLRADSFSVNWAASGPLKLQPHTLPFVPDSMIDAETIWLARCIYSETKRPEEQELIAWVVRNRVESGYRGKSTYRSVVLDPFQFSAFNSDAPKQRFYMSLTLRHDDAGWQRALSIAHYVRHARPQYRPFSAETLHFYSEQSMVGRRAPSWARGLTPVQPPEHYRLDERRFRFYEGIS